jgi:hypothetical protein
LTRKLEQKGSDDFANGVKDGKREIRFKKGNLEVSGNVDKRY